MGGCGAEADAVLRTRLKLLSTAIPALGDVHDFLAGSSEFFAARTVKGTKPALRRKDFMEKGTPDQVQASGHRIDELRSL